MQISKLYELAPFVMFFFLDFRRNILTQYVVGGVREKDICGLDGIPEVPTPKAGSS